MPGTDPELCEHVAQMPLHGPRAEEELRADLRVRQAVAGEPRDLPLLCGQVVTRLDRALADPLARRREFPGCTVAEGFHAERSELIVSRPEVLACLDPALLAPQPFAEEQMSPGELGTPPGPCQSLDRLAIQALGTLTLAQECPAARLGPPAPVGAGGRGGRHHLL